MNKSKKKTKSARHKKSSGQYRRSTHAWSAAIGRSQSCEEGCSESLALLMTELHMTFQQLTEGTLPVDDDQPFFMMYNVLATARIRIKQIPGDGTDALEVIEDSMMAMERVHHRWATQNTWIFEGEEGQAVDDGLNVFETILRASSYLEIQAAFALRQKEIAESTPNPIDSTTTATY